MPPRQLVKVLMRYIHTYKYYWSLHVIDMLVQDQCLYSVWNIDLKCEYMYLKNYKTYMYVCELSNISNNCERLTQFLGVGKTF